MLSTEQKEVILRKAGVTTPPFPRRRLPLQDGDQDGEASASHRQLVAGTGDSGDQAAVARRDEATDAWIKAVDKLYADYALARAAHSLREAEHARTRGAGRSGGTAAASRRGGSDPGPASGQAG
ncbi:hypothetical protein [Variovorax rhizosphaerae]|uniref:Uncharacterized protein n=1 Tax=Variovorax rhizosphaerae TaxID=1836200 RepID=A0ABU8WWF8_9BURK